MANVDMSVQLNAPAGEVWALIGGFDALARWHPAFASSAAEKQGDKTLRRLLLHGGGTIVEALEHHDAGARRYGDTILSSPLPIANYRSELSVEEQGPERCRVTWSSEFKPDGIPEQEAVETIRGVYKAGFDALKSRFGG